MTKAQARRRLAEAGAKIMKVMVAYPEAISPTFATKMIKDLQTINKKLK